MLVIPMTGMGANVSFPISLPQLFRRSFFPAADSAYRRFSLQRLVVMLLFWPVFLGLLLINRLCLWLDTLLFPAFADLEIHQPVFVVGIPRSGTTFLHRLLAGDRQRFTTTALWELIFAPSILQRRFWLYFAALDRKLGAPCAGALHLLERKLLGGLDGVHKTGLLDPEEDYLALAPYLGCFLLILPFGDSAFWRLARLDNDACAADRKRLTCIYRSLIQRHLYVHGGDRTFLSKNPSFTPWLHSLAEEFPDARFVACVRTPHEAVPSQISSILIGARLFSGKPDLDWWRQGLTGMLVHYYKILMDCHQRWPEHRLRIVPMKELAGAPMATIDTIYQTFLWPISDSYRDWLSKENEKAKQYRSGHQYAGEELGISSEEIGQRFEKAIRHFNFSDLQEPSTDGETFRGRSAAPTGSQF
jgi:hypothetical protein